MVEDTIYGLDNREYHYGDGYKDYVSSSQLKLYGVSAKVFRHSLGCGEREETEAMRTGSLYHGCLAALADGAELEEVLDAVRVFEAPVNVRTGRAYGAQTEAYRAAYAAFVAESGAFVATAQEKEQVEGMLRALLRGCGEASESVRKFLRWGKPEVSHFVVYEGERFKYRPDIETERKIVDWKTVGTDDLREESLNRVILRYGYQISAAFYQFMEHERSGRWKRFYLVMQSKVAPWDAVIVDMAEYGYEYDEEADVLRKGCGALEMERLLDLHLECCRRGDWPGVAEGAHGVLRIVPPHYYETRIFEND